MALTHRLFGIRSCNEVITGKRGRPCLEYDIKRCIAPCVDTVCSAEEYGRAVKLTQLFLEGRNDELVKTLQARMVEAAEAERFEEAAQLRDAIRTVQTLQDRQQKMATTELGHRDVFGMKRGPAGVVIQVFQVRSGRVVERIELGTEEAIVGSSDGEVLEAALQQFYELRDRAAGNPCAGRARRTRGARNVAGGAIRPARADRGAAAGREARSHRPGEPQRRAGYQSRFNQTTAAQYDALETLQAVVGLPALPRRIECFDISTIQGSETVAAMVVCEDGRMRRGEYRKFRIRGFRPRLVWNNQPPASAPSLQPDDFAAMHEVVLRRYRKLLEQGGPFPDLILIDGGKGQLSAAYAALEELGLANLVAVGIAKKEELLFTRDRDDAIALAANDPALLLVQRIRDEAHRFAVTFHRRARTMRDLRSELDDVPGVGPRRRRMLLTTFGSLAGVRRATREELAAVVGAKMADAVLAFFASRP